MNPLLALTIHTQTTNAPAPRPQTGFSCRDLLNPFKLIGRVCENWREIIGLAETIALVVVCVIALFQAAFFTAFVCGSAALVMAMLVREIRDLSTHKKLNDQYSRLNTSHEVLNKELSICNKIYEEANKTLTTSLQMLEHQNKDYAETNKMHKQMLEAQKLDFNQSLQDLTDKNSELEGLLNQLTQGSVSLLTSVESLAKFTQSGEINEFNDSLKKTQKELSKMSNLNTNVKEKLLPLFSSTGFQKLTTLIQESTNDKSLTQKIEMLDEMNKTLIRTTSQLSAAQESEEHFKQQRAKTKQEVEELEAHFQALKKQSSLLEKNIQELSNKISFLTQELESKQPSAQNSKNLILPSKENLPPSTLSLSNNNNNSIDGENDHQS